MFHFIIADRKRKDIRSISVRELCASADINRSTFYEYYNSLYDVLPELEETVQKELFSNLELSGDRPENALIGFVQTLKDHRETMMILMGSSIDTDFPDRLLHHPVIMKYITLPETLSVEQRAYTAEFYLYGCYRILSMWLSGGCKENPEEIAALRIDICKRDI